MTNDRPEGANVRKRQSGDWTMASSILDLVIYLRAHPQVVGLVEFGSNHYAEPIITGDYDLLLILDGLELAVTSLHFRAGGIPIDLNVRAVEALRQAEQLSGFERVFLDGRIIHDPTGEIATIFQRLDSQPAQPLPADTIARLRHWHRHILDKVEGRLESEPAFCHLLLDTNIFWLIENYFRTRQLDYRGPKQAWEYLRQEASVVYDLISRFYGTTELHERHQLSERLTALVLEPVGGAWQSEEILAFGPASELQQAGQSLFEQIFGLPL
jgi:hypothetical protein